MLFLHFKEIGKQNWSSSAKNQKQQFKIMSIVLLTILNLGKNGRDGGI